jgi:hypothetical protein
MKDFTPILITFWVNKSYFSQKAGFKGFNKVGRLMKTNFNFENKNQGFKIKLRDAKKIN